MVRYAVGYRSRAFVTFGAPIPVGDVDAAVAQRRARAGAAGPRAHRRALQSAADGGLRRGDAAVDHARAISKSRIDRLIEELAARHANLGVTSGRQAVEEAAEPLETRGIVVAERGRFRVRERNVLRYYARTIEHLLVTTGRTH